MKKYLFIAMMGIALSVSAQDYESDYDLDFEDGSKTCAEWVNQFTSEVSLLESEVSSLKARTKTDNSQELKQQLNQGCQEQPEGGQEGHEERQGCR